MVSGTATSPTGLSGPLIFRAGVTSSVNCFCDCAPAAETLTVKVAVPGAWGVPLSTPFDASERPAGNDPAAMVQLGVADEEAANVDEYELPTLAAGRLAVVIETVAAGGGAAGPPPPEPLIVIVN
jgi:hypothetical protein